MLVSVRRALVAMLIAVVTLPLAAPAASAAPAFRDRPLRTRPNPDVVLRGSGWGHGVGMSQYGAYAQSRAGRGYRQILSHYYSGITVGTAQLPADVRVGLATSMTYSNVDAVTGAVPWKAWMGGRWQTRWQPKGTTWQVSRTPAGAFSLKQGSTEVWRVAAPRLFAAFNWGNPASSPIIEAYNPNYGGRSEYRWGRLEYTRAVTDPSALNLVLHIPSLELYLRGLGEVPASWGASGGMAALQAQAVVARSYAAVLRGSYEDSCRCHLLATPANQVYRGWDHEGGSYGSTWVRAVQGTAGVVAKHDGTPISAFYSSSHGGSSENSEDSWAYSASLPYLRAVADPWSVDAPGNSFAAWQRTVSNASFASFMGGVRTVRSIAIVGRTAGGSPRALRSWGLGSDGRPVSISRTGPKNIVGIALRSAFTYPDKGLSTLPSQQVRRIGFQPFVDDDGSPHEYRIVFATAAGIMERRTPTRFAPRAPVLRRRAALYLYRTLRLPPADFDYYDDDDNSLEEHAINAVARAGISADRAGRAFRPADPLTRGEAAVFLRRALQLSPTSRDYFTDDAGSPQQGAINAVRRAGLLVGCTQTAFCPDRALTRAEMATALYRAVEAHR